jgi:hypothetical protein
MARAEGLEPPTNPVLEAGALPLSYARVAGEIGIEPMASCASDRRSTHAELLAVLMCRVDLAGLEPAASALQVRCSPVLSYRPRVPPPSLAGGYSITPGQASTRPSVRCGPHPYERHSISPRDKEKGPHRDPADRVERIQSFISGAPRMRTTSEPASHRCVLGFYQGRWRCGSIVATLTRPASLHYSVVVQERSTRLALGGGRRNRTFPFPMDPTRGHGAWGWITHGIHGDRERRLGPLIDDETELFRLRSDT